MRFSGVQAARTWAGTGRSRSPLPAAEAAAGFLPRGSRGRRGAAGSKDGRSPSRPQGKRRLPGRAESEARQHGALGRRWRRREELGARHSALGTRHSVRVAAQRRSRAAPPAPQQQQQQQEEPEPPPTERREPLLRAADERRAASPLPPLRG